MFAQEVLGHSQRHSTTRIFPCGLRIETTDGSTITALFTGGPPSTICLSLTNYEYRNRC